MTMPKFPFDELVSAYETFKRVSDACAESGDYNAFADLFTEDCVYIEHVFGEMHGREAVRAWIVPLMQSYPNNQMTKYTHDWVYFNGGCRCPLQMRRVQRLRISAESSSSLCSPSHHPGRPYGYER